MYACSKANVYTVFTLILTVADVISNPSQLGIEPVSDSSDEDMVGSTMSASSKGSTSSRTSTTSRASTKSSKSSMGSTTSVDSEDGDYEEEEEA